VILMRFLKRETELQTLQRRWNAIEVQIGEAKASLTALKGNGLIDPVLQKFLQERLAFDYEFEKEKLARAISAKEAELTQLEKEKKKLEPELQELAFQQKLRDMQIRFEGVDVDGYVGSIVKIHCSHCGHRFQTDLRSHGSFNNVISCSNQTALNQIYAMKANRAWPFQCQKCHVEVDVWIFRGKI